MKIGIWGASVALGMLVTLSGCATNTALVPDPSPSQVDESLKYVMNACYIDFNSDGSPIVDESGDVSRTSERATDSVNIVSDSIPALQRQYNDWAEITANANAAAQTDSEWQALATAMTERAGYLAGWLSTRKSGQGFSPNVDSEVQKANRLLAEYLSICDGLSIRLSKP